MKFDIEYQHLLKNKDKYNHALRQELGRKYITRAGDYFAFAEDRSVDIYGNPDTESR